MGASSPELLLCEFSFRRFCKDIVEIYYKITDCISQIDRKISTSKVEVMAFTGQFPIRTKVVIHSLIKLSPS
jgi:hypothetical protein